MPYIIFNMEMPPIGLTGGYRMLWKYTQRSQNIPAQSVELEPDHKEAHGRATKGAILCSLSKWVSWDTEIIHTKETKRVTVQVTPGPNLPQTTQDIPGLEMSR